MLKEVYLLSGISYPKSWAMQVLSQCSVKQPKASKLSFADFKSVPPTSLTNNNQYP
jgi:hypothetical protein